MLEDANAGGSPRLRTHAQVILVTIGVILMAVPIAAYLDVRLELLGASDGSLGGLDLMWAVVFVVGVLLVLSGWSGYLILWSGMQLDSVPGTPSTGDPRDASMAGGPEEAAKPPFKGDFVSVPVDKADKAFAVKAEDYFYKEFGQQKDFSEAVQGVYRSSIGRPNWAFEVRLADGRSKWIYVPHRGRGGSGASDARDGGAS